MSVLRDTVEGIVREAVEETGGLPGLVVGEFVVIAVANGWTDDGEDISQVVTIPDGGGQSRILGLLDYVLTQYRAEIARTD